MYRKHGEVRTGDRLISRKILMAVGYPVEGVYERRVLELALPKESVKPTGVRFLNQTHFPPKEFPLVVQPHRIALVSSQPCQMPQCCQNSVLTFAAERCQLFCQKQCLYILNLLAGIRILCGESSLATSLTENTRKMLCMVSGFYCRYSVSGIHFHYKIIHCLPFIMLPQ